MTALRTRGFRARHTLARRIRAAVRRTPFEGVLAHPRITALARRVILGRLGRRDAAEVKLSVGGLTLWAPGKYVDLYMARDYEPLLVERLPELIGEGGTVVDVGAHIGYLTLRLSRIVGSTGRVIALEPADENLAFLHRNLAVNGAANVEVLAVAAGDSAQMRTFRLTGSSDSHSFYAHPLTPTVREVEVRQVPLDDLCDAPPDLVKIDVEGAELDVLAGMRRLLDLPSPMKLVVEWTPACQAAAGHQAADLPRRLMDLGFDIVAVDDTLHRVGPVDRFIDEHARGLLPIHWYCNLICLPGARRPASPSVGD